MSCHVVYLRYPSSKLVGPSEIAPHPDTSPIGVSLFPQSSSTLLLLLPLRAPSSHPRRCSTPPPPLLRPALCSVTSFSSSHTQSCQHRPGTESRAALQHLGWREGSGGGGEGWGGGGGGLFNRHTQGETRASRRSEYQPLNMRGGKDRALRVAARNASATLGLGCDIMPYKRVVLLPALCVPYPLIPLSISRERGAREMAARGLLPLRSCNLLKCNWLPFARKYPTVKISQTDIKAAVSPDSELKRFCQARRPGLSVCRLQMAFIIFLGNSWSHVIYHYRSHARPFHTRRRRRRFVQ